MKAVQYFQMFNIPCAFFVAHGAGEKACGEPAVGVYVSDDPQPRGVFVCAAHAEEAEEMADGPVFYTDSTHGH